MSTFLKTVCLALACGATLVAPATGLAQSEGNRDDNPLDPKDPRAKVLVGPRIGTNRNFHTGGFRTINDPSCPVYESGSGWGFLAGFTAEFQTGATWSIVPAVVYESRPGNFTQELPDAKVLLPGQTEPINQTVSTSSDITYSFLSAEVMYKQEISQIGKNFRISVTAGPVASYVMGGKVTQVLDLEEPQNARFLNPENLETRNNGRTLVYADNIDIDGRASTRFSLKGGLQAEIGLFKNQWMLYPGVFYDYGLSNVTDKENWSLNSVVMQVDLRRAF